MLLSPEQLKAFDALGTTALWAPFVVVTRPHQMDRDGNAPDPPVSGFSPPPAACG